MPRKKQTTETVPVKNEISEIPLYKQYVCPRDKASMSEMVCAVERGANQMREAEREIVLRMVIEDCSNNTEAYIRNPRGTMVNLSKIPPRTLIKIYEYIVFHIERTP